MTEEVIPSNFNPRELLNPNGAQPVVLVVDDEPVILKAISRLLTREKIPVLTAENADAALKILDTSLVGVIMSDQRMPGMPGTELLEIVREKYPDIVRIMITGNSDQDTAIDAINRGAVFRFLTKPWSGADLLQLAHAAREQNDLRRSRSIYEKHIRTQNAELIALNESLEMRVQERTRETSELYTKLERGFDGTMRALLSTMGLGSNLLVNHCERTLKRISDFAPLTGLSEEALKPLRRAAMFHWIGLINAPETLFRKNTSDYDSDELVYWEFHSLLGHQTLADVEALKEVSEIILFHLRRWDDPSFRVGSDQVVGFQHEHLTEERILSCQVLQISSTYEKAIGVAKANGEKDQLKLSELGMMAVKRLANGGVDPAIVELFLSHINRNRLGKKRSITQIPLPSLETGMILARPVLTSTGIPVAGQDVVLTDELLERLSRFQATSGLDDIFIYEVA